MSAGTAIRTVRIGNDLWRQAADIAEAEGRTVSEVIRALLVEYVRKNAA